MQDDPLSSRIRLSDRILTALELAVDQEDLKICESLVQALDLSMTRNTGGGEFIERRDYSEEMQQAMNAYAALRSKENNAA